MLCDSHALVIAHPCSTRWQMLTNTRSVNRRAWPRGLRLGWWGGRRTSNSTLFVSSAVTLCGSWLSVSAIIGSESIKEIKDCQCLECGRQSHHHRVLVELSHFGSLKVLKVRKVRKV